MSDPTTWQPPEDEMDGPAPGVQAAPTVAQPAVPATSKTAPASPASGSWQPPEDEMEGPAPGAAQPVTQEQQSNQLLKMLNDVGTTGDQIRKLYKDQNIQLPEEANNLLTMRDAYIAANHKTPTIGVGGDPLQPSSTTTLVDNRPLSWGDGFVDGLEHVGENVVGGLGLVANANSALGSPFGIQNNWKNDVHNYYQGIQGARQDQGSANGRLAGEITASLPAGLVAAPVAAGASPVLAGAGLGVGATELGASALGLGSAGALQSLLTTHETTPGGIAKDAALGAGTGALLGQGSKWLGEIAANPTAETVAGRQVLDAANRLSRDGINVAPLPGDTGGPLSRGLSAVADSGIVSNGPYSKGINNYLTATQAARDRVAATLMPGGAAARPLDAVAGDARNSVGGLGDYEARSGEQIGQQYDNAANMARGVQIQTPRARAALDALIAQAEATPGETPGLGALRTLRDDLTPTSPQASQSTIWDREFGGGTPQVTPGNPAEYAIDNLRRLRTSFGDNFDSNQRAAREAANTIWGPLSEDIQSGLRAQGRGDAADAYRAADQAWAQRQTNLDEIVNPVMGNRSQEQLADQFRYLAGNDSDTLNRALALMSPDQAAQVRAGLVGELGRANPGAQNAEGNAFSLAKLGTDAGNDRLSPGFKSTLPSQVQNDLSDLSVLADRAKATGRYRNTSGTARAVNALDLIKSLTSTLGAPLSGAYEGSGAGLLGTGLGAGGAIVGQYGLGRAMASPGLARGLVTMGEVRPIARGAQALTYVAGKTVPAYNNDPRNSMSDDHH